ncbi:hypothetical protein [Metabacillus indicus]|uniref:hypothetical protein n=1 Tax=Metabacillus indicus TaxID=246786 RepID=UPI000A817E66|nr:hypothetical protein [Metabacillus indicus]
MIDEFPYNVFFVVIGILYSMFRSSVHLEVKWKWQFSCNPDAEPNFPQGAQCAKKQSWCRIAFTDPYFIVLKPLHTYYV